LQDVVDQAVQILTDAYTPESSREDLAAVGDALDALEGNGGDEDEDEEVGDDYD
jgi:hypothetical protein